ncbi:MAG: ATP-dependent DNA helicase RecG [Candidatus Electronema aureum]|uniref:ATP-dependent DNA helicase RecG n=1 Tax=Candidatus Electronema aureum TaxID=2005002 RepID=A0A521G4G0_9BACT|nr:MAG: ATP-dependent DNA helicase RecG [Candidatus Electronema aureum]
MWRQAGQRVFFVAAQEDAQYHEECNILEEMRNSYSLAHEKTMRTAELLEIIRNGENSGVEFKRDDIRPEQLAKEIVALANLQGGRVLLGVEDNGAVTGIRRPDLQEWVLNVFRDKVHPQIIPFYEEMELEEGCRVAVVSLSPGIAKPYVLRHNGREDVYIRMGDRSELATREQQLRLFQSGGMLHVETLPVAGTSIDFLDLDRLNFYLASIIEDPELPVSREQWIERLLGLGLMAEDGLGNKVCSIAGLVCFGIRPRRYLPQAGLRLMVFDGKDKEYQARLDTVLDGPLAGRWRMIAGQRELVDRGVIEQFAAAIQPFISCEEADVDETMRRGKEFFYPWQAVRETVINALAHRDWSRSVDVEVSSYADRLEVISPGALQNSMTVAKMIAGQRSPRNPLIMEILRDYGYVDARGMGVRTKVIPLMRQHNGAEPVFEASEDCLKIVLPKRKHNRN